MSFGPIQIQSYPHKPFLNNQNELYVNSTTKESIPVDTQSSSSTVETHIGNDIIRRKRQITDEYINTCSPNNYPINQQIECRENLKRPKLASRHSFKPPNFIPTQTSFHEIVASEEASNSHLNSLKNNLNNGSLTKSMHNINSDNYSETVSHVQNFGNLKISNLPLQQQTTQLTRTETEPFDSKTHVNDSSQYLISQFTDMIFSEIKNAQSLEQARETIQHHITKLLSLIQSSSNITSTSCQDRISLANVKDIIQERDCLDVRANSLDIQLKEEQSLSKNKDILIQELKSEISEKNIMLNRINEWAESYFNSPNLMVYKSCGFDERRPPDVF